MLQNATLLEITLQGSLIIWETENNIEIVHIVRTICLLVSSADNLTKIRSDNRSGSKMLDTNEVLPKQFFWVLLFS